MSRENELFDIIEHVLQKDKPHAHLDTRQRTSFAREIAEVIGGYINTKVIGFEEGKGPAQKPRVYTPTDRYAWHVNYDGSKNLSRLYMVGDGHGDYSAEWRSVECLTSEEMRESIRIIEDGLAR